MVCYFVPLKSGSQTEFMTPFESFTCLHRYGMENHAKYGEAIYFHSADTLFVNLYLASELDWRAKGLRVRQETAFPASGKVSFAVKAGSPTPLTLKLRQPAWCQQPPAVCLNGKRLKISARGRLSRHYRTWQDGDRVELELPLAPPHRGPCPTIRNASRFSTADPTRRRPRPRWQGCPRAGAFDREPSRGQVGQARQGPSRSPSAPRTSGGRWTSPSLLSTGFTVAATRSIGTSSPSRNGRRAKPPLRVEEARLKALAARTTDLLAIGEMQPERDHNVQGENTAAGEALGRKFRHATEGGWFAFDLAVTPDQPVDLVLTYWGSDTHNRVFDILADGTKLATQTLDRNEPDKFFDVTYPLPGELTQGKRKVTIRIQAQPGKWAGGVFGVRMLKRQ